MIVPIKAVCSSSVPRPLVRNPIIKASKPIPIKANDQVFSFEGISNCSLIDDDIVESFISFE
jgi:hypothetical protein